MAKKKINRTSVPLVMIEGNLEILLENTIYCTGISLREYDRGVVLVVQGINPEQAEELGFQTTNTGARFSADEEGVDDDD